SDARDLAAVLRDEPELRVEGLAIRPVLPLVERVALEIALLRERFLVSVIDGLLVLLAAVRAHGDPVRPLRLGESISQLDPHPAGEVIELVAARLEEAPPLWIVLRRPGLGPAVGRGHLARPVLREVEEGCEHIVPAPDVDPQDLSVTGSVPHIH